MPLLVDAIEPRHGAPGRGRRRFRRLTEVYDIEICDCATGLRWFRPDDRLAQPYEVVTN
jgi:hypothetical protein